nr:hypothetical protein [Tanacetum cinerariifolium]
MVGSPHRFIIHWIVVMKNIEEVMEVIDVKNWLVDNSRVLWWIISLVKWNSSVFVDGVFDSEYVQVKEYQEKDKIESKPDKKEKRGEARKSQKQLQSIKQEKLKKTQVEGPKMQTHSKLLKEERKKGVDLQFLESSSAGCGNDLLNGFCSLCNSRNSYVYDPNPNSFNFPLDSYHPPHPTYETYSYDSYGNNSQCGYDCQPQFPLNYESEPGYNENYNSYPYDSSSLPQQYPCCTHYGGPHETCQYDQLIFDEPYCKHCGGPHMNIQCQPMNQDSYNSNSLGFNQPQPPQSPVIHQPPQELSIQEMEDLKQQYLDELKRLSNLEYRNENKIAELRENFNVTPILSTEEPDNSLIMGDEHLDTLLATESDKVIKSIVEDLFPIPSESEGIPEHKRDVPSHDNSPPLDVSKYQFEDLSESNEEFSSTDDDSFSFDKIDNVEASPPDSELVSSEVMEIVIPKVGGIEASNDNPFLFYDPIISGTPPNLTPSGEKDMLLLKAFLNDDHSSDFKTKSSSTSLNSLLEETNNFDNSLPEFTTFSNVLFDAKYESDSNDNQSCFDEDVLEKIVSKPLLEEEIIPMKIDQHLDNAESALIESLHTHDSSLLILSKIDSLLDEFTGELTLLKSIPPRIDETDCYFEGDIRRIEKLLYDNFSPRPPKEFVSANSDAKIKSFSPSPILVKDNDSLMEEIDLFCTPDYPMPSGIEDDDYDSERDILILKDLPSNNTISFAKKESFHFDIPLFSRPPAKPPDGEISYFLSHRGLKAFQHSAKCPMMIHGHNNPILDVLFGAECESDSNNDQSCLDEDVLEKIVSTPLSEEEIIPMESLHEFAGELTLLKSIRPGIDETDCDFEEDIRLIEKLLYDNSSPRPPKEFVFANSDAKIKFFSPSPILEKSPDLLSYRCGTVKKFNTHRSHLNKCPMLINGQNNPPLDVLLIPGFMKILANGFHYLKSSLSPLFNLGITKADEGFFIGYSLNSKAFRVFHSRTRIVEENFHIRFSESIPNVVGTQSNGFADTKASDNAGQARKGTKPVKDYILLPLWTTDVPFSQDLKKKEDNVNNTNNVNTVSSTVNTAGTNGVNDVGENISIKLQFDPNMPAVEDVSTFDFSRDDEDDDAVADMNNLDTSIQVSPIPTTRIHKDHPLDQVIGDLQSSTQTRKMSKILEEHGFEEPKKVIHALKDPSWIEAMQEELLQFKLQEVWPLVDLLNGKRAIDTKWVFRNKKDERGIVIRNKARLVAQGYTQE